MLIKIRDMTLAVHENRHAHIRVFGGVIGHGTSTFLKIYI